MPKGFPPNSVFFSIMRLIAAVSPSFSARGHSGFVVVLILAVLWRTGGPVQGQSFDYPNTKTVDSVDIYYGTRVPAPYRWMKDFDSEVVQRWVEKQNELTFGYLEQVPERECIRSRLRTLWDYPKYGVPGREAGRLYYRKNEGLQDQSEDRLVYERPDNPKLGFGTEVTHDGRYLVIQASEGTSEKTELYVKNLRADGAEIRPLIEGFDASYNLIGADGSTFFIQTNLDAPNRRIIAVDAENPNRSTWRTIVPESEAVLQGADLAGGSWSWRRSPT